MGLLGYIKEVMKKLISLVFILYFYIGTLLAIEIKPFRIEIGEILNEDYIIEKNTLSSLEVATIVTINPPIKNEHFNKYTVSITPISNRVAAISACRINPSETVISREEYYDKNIPLLEGIAIKLINQLGFKEIARTEDIPIYFSSTLGNENEDIQIDLRFSALLKPQGICIHYFSLKMTKLNGKEWQQFHRLKSKKLNEINIEGLY